MLYYIPMALKITSTFLYNLTVLDSDWLNRVQQQSMISDGRTDKTIKIHAVNDCKVKYNIAIFNRRDTIFS